MTSSLVFVLAIFFYWTRAVVTSGASVENYDPELADERGAIICRGPRPPFELPVFDDWNPNVATLTQICAKSQYNGHRVTSPTSTRGNTGWCYLSYYAAHFMQMGMEPVHPQNSWKEIVFDNNEEAYSSYARNLSHPRLLAYCAIRCYCKSDAVGSMVSKPMFSGPKPLKTSDIEQDGYRQTSAYKLQLDMTGAFNMSKPLTPSPSQDYVMRFDGVRQTRADMNVRANVDLTAGAYSGHIDLTLDNSNIPVCVSDKLPEFPLPRVPYGNGLPDRITISPFVALDNEFGPNHAQQLCAVSLAGGNPYVNAGGYCHRLPLLDNHPLEPRRSTLWFSEEWTPRLEWTVTYNWAFAIQMQTWCRQRCRCAGEEDSRVAGSVRADLTFWSRVNRVNPGAFWPDSLGGQYFALTRTLIAGVINGFYALAQLVAAQSNSRGREGQLQVQAGSSSSGGSGGQLMCPSSPAIPLGLCAAAAVAFTSGIADMLDGGATIALRPLGQSRVRAGACGVAGTEACPAAPWPSTRLGPKPGLSPPGLPSTIRVGGVGTSERRGAAAILRSSGYTSCGGRCTGPGQCAGERKIRGCRCIAAGVKGEAYCLAPLGGTRG